MVDKNLPLSCKIIKLDSSFLYNQSLINKILFLAKYYSNVGTKNNLNSSFNFKTYKC